MTQLDKLFHGKPDAFNVTIALRQTGGTLTGRMTLKAQPVDSSITARRSFDCQSDEVPDSPEPLEAI